MLVLLPADKGSSPARGDLGSALRGLFALSCLALVLACVNVACLSAVRSASREQEIAIRLALGARHSRLQRQLLTEGLVLAATRRNCRCADRSLGGASARRRSVHRAPDRDGPPPAGVDRSVCSCPDERLHRGAPADPRVEEDPTRPDVERWNGLRPATSIVSSRTTGSSTLQIAMALSMLVSAALLVQSLRSLSSVDPGLPLGQPVARIARPGRRRLRLQPDRWLLASHAGAAAAQYPASRASRWRRPFRSPPGRQRQPWVIAATGDKIEIDTNFVGPSLLPDTRDSAARRA